MIMNTSYSDKGIFRLILVQPLDAQETLSNCFVETKRILTVSVNYFNHLSIVLFIY